MSDMGGYATHGGGTFATGGNIEARPLLTREQVESVRIDLVKFPNAPISPTRVRDLVDAYLALAGQLAAVDAFAQEPDDTALGNGYTAAHADGKNALRRELRAVRGIGAP